MATIGEVKTKLNFREWFNGAKLSQLEKYHLECTGDSKCGPFIKKVEFDVEKVDENQYVLSNVKSGVMDEYEQLYARINIGQYYYPPYVSPEETRYDVSNNTLTNNFMMDVEVRYDRSPGPRRLLDELSDLFFNLPVKN